MSWHRIAASVAAGVLAVGLSFAWLEFAPDGLGGRTTYVLVEGASMEPGLDSGDLVILRKAASYEPGDVVAYKSAKLGHLVLHRIVSADGGRVTTKGDGNDFIDPDHPRVEDLTGRSWATVPHGGAVLRWLRQPFHAGTLGGAAALLLALAWLGIGLGPRPGRTQRSRRNARPRGRRMLDAGFVSLGAFAAGSLALALVAFSRPVTDARTIAEAYRHISALRYEARTPRSAAYPSGRVEPGQPIFTRLIDQVDVAYSYRIDSAYNVEAGGAASLVAIVGDANGWQKSIELAPPTSFLGRETTVRGTLDLARIDKLLARLERDTGVAPTAVTLTIEPRVVVEGRVDGEAISDTHESRFTFAVEQDRVTLAPSSDDTRPRSLSHVEPRSLSRAATPAEISILGQTVSVSAGRRASLALLAGSLLAIGFLLVLRARHRPRSEHDRIVDRYGYAIVPAATSEQAEDRREVDLPSIRDLLRLAENHGALVLHETAAGECFWFELGRTTFRYVPVPSAEAPLSEPKTAQAALAPKPGLVAGTR